MADERHVRLAGPEHLDAVAQLYDALTDYLESHVNYPGWGKDIYPTRETAEEGLQSGALYVCMVAGAVAGTCILDGIQPERYANVSWQAGNRPDEVLVVHTLAVYPAYFRRGISETLLQFTDQYARQNGKTSIRLDVLPSNTPGVSLYRKNGYQLAGELCLQRGPWDQAPFYCFEKIIR
mgnify:CR=1 FL=1